MQGSAPVVVIAVACVLLAAVVVAVAVVLVVLRLEEARLRRAPWGAAFGEPATREPGQVVVRPQVVQQPDAQFRVGALDQPAARPGAAVVHGALAGNGIAAGTATMRGLELERLLAPAESAWMSQAAAAIRTAADPSARRALAAQVVQRGGAGAAWVVLDAVRAGAIEPWVACEELSRGSFDIGVVAGAASVDNDPRVRAVAQSLLDGVLATTPLPRFVDPAPPARTESAVRTGPPARTESPVRTESLAPAELPARIEPPAVPLAARTI